ncbi:excalibur calcium-binding domain-containing protein [Pelagibacterium halotolerans]|uniref:excalibur calcium-binding domain-containing protein n=1 Tax=Pelagibacterium halotolerans TaxID=531813 RepID=UPI00384DFCC5
MRRALGFLLLYCATSWAAIAVGQEWRCDRKPACTQIRSCAEADFYFRQCGHAQRDGDNDGIPCEALCGDAMELYLLRRGQPSALSTVNPDIAGQFAS